eukprot:scaffold647197_cov14-Prasinocladus_malaysianus.AAC.1
MDFDPDDTLSCPSDGEPSAVRRVLPPPLDVDESATVDGGGDDGVSDDEEQESESSNPCLAASNVPMEVDCGLEDTEFGYFVSLYAANRNMLRYTVADYTTGPGTKPGRTHFQYFKHDDIIKPVFDFD